MDIHQGYVEQCAAFTKFLLGLTNDQLERTPEHTWKNLFRPQQEVMTKIKESQQKQQQSSSSTVFSTPLEQGINRLEVVFKYFHKSQLEIGLPKYSHSKGAYYLSGDSGSFQPDLYCFSSEALKQLRYSDDPDYIVGFHSKGWTRTPQYFSVEGHPKNIDYDFRCADANRFHEAEILQSAKQWEDYYNASVRSSKQYLHDITLDWKQHNLLVLHSGIAHTKSATMLDFLKAEKEESGLSGQPVIKIRKIVWSKPVLTVEWMTDDSGEEFYWPISVFKIPAQFTQVISKYAIYCIFPIKND